MIEYQNSALIEKMNFPVQMESYCAGNVYHMATSVYGLVYSAILYINILHDIRETKFRDVVKQTNLLCL